MAAGDTRIGALPEDVPLTVERLVEALARYEDNTARQPDAIHVTHAQWTEFAEDAGGRFGTSVAWDESGTYFQGARVELVQPGEATGVWCEAAGNPPGLPLVAGVISPLRGPVELRQESDAPWRSAVFCFVGDDRYAEFVRDESGREIESWQRSDPPRQAVTNAVAKLASGTAQSTRWMLRWIDEETPRPLTVADLRRAEAALRANAVRQPPPSLEEFVRMVAPRAADSLAGRAILGVDWSRDRDRTGVVVRAVANPGGGELSFQMEASRDGANWVRLPAGATVEMLEAQTPRSTVALRELSEAALRRIFAPMRYEPWAADFPSDQMPTIGDWRDMAATLWVSESGGSGPTTWDTATADELLAYRRKLWRDEAHKRTCEACARREVVDFNASPSEVRDGLDLTGWDDCPDCEGTGYTLAPPITRAQLRLRLAWWERDRLAECDDEPSKAWYAGNAALVAELAKWCSPGARAQRRAAVREIPDGPWRETKEASDA